MILAYLNGDLISVELLQSHPITTRVRDVDGKEYCYRVSDKHRKLFDGKNAVYDAINILNNAVNIDNKVWSA